ncbi:MAG: hypothetical protein P4L16_05850 [Chlamydiales bacterium]|nr:hypothetical protein [Chlamydiales bacterium]
MKKLNRIELEFEQAFKYVIYNLEGGQSLSVELIAAINFREGCFFTLLPDDYNHPILYQFECGGILPQNPTIEYEVCGEKCSYSIIPTIQNELSLYILDRLKLSDNVSCIFDDVLRSTNSPDLKMPPLNHLIFTHDNEVYFIIQDNFNADLIALCIEKSNHIWHSLAVLTTANLQNIVGRKLQPEHVKSICLNAQLIIVGSYDGEGYIFWERNSYSKKS